MNIAVCIKQVPDTETKIKLNDGKNSVIEEDINFILNPYDEFAVEEALKIADAHAGEITVISLGPERIIPAIRSALAMGAHKAIRIKADRHPEDPLVIADALAQVMKEGQYDMIFLGKQAIDDDHSQMASLLAVKMNIPAVTVVVKLEVDGNKVKAEREIDGAHEIIECNLPVIIGAQRGLNEPRYASLKGIMKAKKIQIEELEIPLREDQLEVVGFDYPPEKAQGKIIGKDAGAVSELVRLLHEEAKVI